MCSAAAIGPAASAIGSAAQASANNKHKRKMYEHQLKVRKRKWMQTRTTYASKKVQFEQEVDLSKIAAQRAYTKTQQQLNNAKSLAILQNQEDFKKMLQNEGMIEAKAAERGVRGASVARQLIMNKGNFGVGQAMRSRALASAYYQAKDVNADVNRQLKAQLNKSFGKVAIQPIQDFAPPPPQMENVGLTFMVGMANAIGEGIGGMPSNSGSMSYTNTAPSGQQYGAMASDIRLKENIEEVGVSPQGYKIYEFNYKGGDVRFRGAMAQDVVQKNPMAVGIDQNYLTVDYSKIDVDMEVV